MVQLTIRVSPELLARLKADAEAMDRTVAQSARYMLAFGLNCNGLWKVAR